MHQALEEERYEEGVEVSAEQMVREFMGRDKEGKLLNDPLPEDPSLNAIHESGPFECGVLGDGDEGYHCLFVRCLDCGLFHYEEVAVIAESEEGIVFRCPCCNEIHESQFIRQE